MLQQDLKTLKKRLIDISYRHKLSHIGSCLTTLPILCGIFDQTNHNDIVVLSNGHAGLALYVVLERKFGHDAEELLHTHGIHPCTDLSHNIHCSTGSLGLGLPIAIGFSLAKPQNAVFCVMSDGECAEGSVWESFNFLSKFYVPNLKIYLNANGYSAYAKIDTNALELRIRQFTKSVEVVRTNSDLPFVSGLESHYHTLKNQEQYEQSLAWIEGDKL
jgi:transketolase